MERSCVRAIFFVSFFWPLYIDRDAYTIMHMYRVYPLNRFLSRHMLQNGPVCTFLHNPALLQGSTGRFFSVVYTWRSYEENLWNFFSAKIDKELQFFWNMKKRGPKGNQEDFVLLLAVPCKKKLYVLNIGCYVRKAAWRHNDCFAPRGGKNAVDSTCSRWRE